MELNMKYVISLLIVFLISCSTSTSDEPNVSHDSDEWQIWAYSKAAPDFIGEFATIVGGDGKVIREGSNGWTCTATLEMPEGGFETPQHGNTLCADEEGFKWAEAYMTGGKPNMKRDAYIWMLNGDMGEDNMNSSFYGGDHDKAKMMGHFIESGPHLMLMPKDTKTIDNFPTDFKTGAPYQMFKGTPYAHLMIPVDGYYEFQPNSNPLN
jgi:hypothetical protein